MNVAVLGTGPVGQAIANRFVASGHAVRMGGRSLENERAQGGAAAHGPQASTADFAGAASFADLVVNCTSGTVSLDALRQAGEDNLANKILIDVANPLTSGGEATALSVCNTDSLAEQIQRAFPQTRVVKALNTMNNAVMGDPDRVPGDHNVFVCGNDDAAKSDVVELLRSFGWPAENIIDLGDITAARGTEMYLILWVRLCSILGTADFNIKIVQGDRALKNAGSRR
jgi:8-hydroxy-5-deazaflavin:NADPH oxidoreductase